jgi:hypothetical protein
MDKDGVAVFFECNMSRNPLYCCVHDKPRTFDCLEEVERGIYRCIKAEKCMVGTSDRYDRRMCCVHKKKRAPDFLEEMEDGIYRCKPDDPCLVSSADMAALTSGKRPRDDYENDDRRPRGRSPDRGRDYDRDYDRGRDRDRDEPRSTRRREGPSDLGAPLSEDQRMFLYAEGMKMMAMAMGMGWPAMGAPAMTPMAMPGMQPMAPFAWPTMPSLTGSMPAPIMPRLEDNHLPPRYHSWSRERSRSPEHDRRRAASPDRDRRRGDATPNRLRTVICTLHNKPRLMEWVEETSPGQFACRPGSECKTGAA